jgi:hypothetical protein
MENTILLLVSLVFFTGYLIYVYTHYGVTDSISLSYYSLPKNYQWLFTVMTLGYALPLMLIGHTPLFWIAGACICFCGAAPAYRSGIPLETNVHIIGSEAGIAIAGLAMWTDLHLWFFTVILVLFTAYCVSKWNKINHHVWWIETLVYGLIILSFIIKRIFV